MEFKTPSSPTGFSDKKRRKVGKDTPKPCFNRGARGRDRDRVHAQHQDGGGERKRKGETNKKKREKRGTVSFLPSSLGALCKCEMEEMEEKEGGRKSDHRYSFSSRIFLFFLFYSSLRHFSVFRERRGRRHQKCILSNGLPPPPLLWREEERGTQLF